MSPQPPPYQPIYSTYWDLTGVATRFDQDRLSDEDRWYGRADRDGELLCRVRLARGVSWILVYLGLSEAEANVFTLEELESLALGRNYWDQPVNRELGPHDATLWLEWNQYPLPDDLEVGPPCAPEDAPPRLQRHWQPEVAATPQAPRWRSPVVLRGPHDPPVVNGQERPPLTRTQYAVIHALVEAGPAGLSGLALARASQHDDAVKILKRLASKDPAWNEVIQLAGQKGSPYRLA